ncbi:hypothetical protein RDI58_016635 [Solanum bulbocastanum]|uniref:Uncharacterized protein n=1 Tax=Solanum bulbocastanum TaxID=147425 RepID=A0AAN8YCK2_SOLBU
MRSLLMTQSEELGLFNWVFNVHVRDL